MVRESTKAQKRQYRSFPRSPPRVEQWCGRAWGSAELWGEGGQVRRNKQIYLPAPLSDYFAPHFCSRPYETQMSSEARASYRALSITSLCAPEALTLDYWLQHKGCFCHQPRYLRRFHSQGFFFLKRNFIWQLMHGILHRSRLDG